MDFFKKNKSIFIAYPYDVLTKNMYRAISKKLQEKWDVRFGADVLKVNNNSSERERFLNRNKQLYEIFVSSIQKSDIFIADLTNTNPNVMVELGIAVQLNKNVILVTSQDYNKLPFNIKGFEVDKYTSKKDLIEILNKHLDLFTKINKQNFDNYIDECYTKVEKYKFDINQRRSVIPIKIPEKIKNLKLRLEYKFLSITDEQDWLGIHLRASDTNPIFSELVYIRSNTHLESVTLPTRSTPYMGQESRNKIYKLDDGFTMLEIQVEGNKLKAATSEKELIDDSLQLETFGNIYIQANAHKARISASNNLVIEIRNLEIINIDTTTPI